MQKMRGRLSLPVVSCVSYRTIEDATVWRVISFCAAKNGTLALDL